MDQDRFWMRSWDPWVHDLDPQQFEISFVDAIRPAFEKYPDIPAMIYMDKKISFRELDSYSNRFAQMLAENGIGKGDVVGINLPNIPEYVIAWLGALKAGCAVSGVSPLLSTEEMHHQLSDSKAKALVTLDAIFEGRLTKIADRLNELKVVVAAEIGGFLPPLKRFLGKILKKIPTGKVTPLTGKVVYTMADIIFDDLFADEFPDVVVFPEDTAYIQYTGGTTGPPKGAMLSHRNIVSDVLIIQHWLNWTEGSGIALSGFPFFHIAGLFFNMNCVYLGWTQVLIPNPRDTDLICKQMAKYKPKVLANVPTLYQLLLNNPKFAKLDHSHLEACVSAAAPFPEESQKQFESIVGQGKLVEGYGMTETSPLTVMNPFRGKKKLGHIGLPIPNTYVKLVDPSTGKQVPIGEPGEICIKGPQVMMGYFNRPDETQKAIDADGYLHTGDVAVFDDEGYLRIVDRTKDMIIVGGFKVFSKKVEESLAEHPAIDLVALIGVDNPQRPGSEIVKAFITLKPEYKGKDTDKITTDILQFAKKKLAPYEVPKAIEIRDELPLTAVGKIDKKVLRAGQKKG